MDSRDLAHAAISRQRGLTKEAADAATRGRALQAAGERAQARSERLRAIPIKKAR
jgi:hypothetical protein